MVTSFKVCICFLKHKYLESSETPYSIQDILMRPIWHSISWCISNCTVVARMLRPRWLNQTPNITENRKPEMFPVLLLNNSSSVHPSTFKSSEFQMSKIYSGNNIHNAFTCWVAIMFIPFEIFMFSMLKGYFL